MDKRYSLTALFQAVWAESFMESFYVESVDVEEGVRKAQYEFMQNQSTLLAAKKFPTRKEIFEYINYVRGDFNFRTEQDAIMYAVKCLREIAKVSSRARYLRFKTIGR